MLDAWSAAYTRGVSTLRHAIVIARGPAQLGAAAAELERQDLRDPVVGGMLWQLLGDRLRASQAPQLALHAYRRAGELRQRGGPRYQLLESRLAEGLVCAELGLLPDALTALAAAVMVANPLHQAGIGALRFAAELQRRCRDERAAIRCEADAAERHERQSRLLKWDHAGHMSPTWYREPQGTSLQFGWIVPYLTARHPRRMWIPSPYVTLEPFMFAAFGIDVVVSDVSPASVERFTAAAHAPDLAELVATSLQRCSASWHQCKDDLPPIVDRPGSVRVVEHDPCEPFEVDGFDLIAADHLLQYRLSSPEHRRVARVFASALRPGGALFVSPLHAPSERECYELESPFIAVGFYPPAISYDSRKDPHARRLFVNYSS